MNIWCVEKWKTTNSTLIGQWFIRGVLLLIIGQWTSIVRRFNCIECVCYEWCCLFGRHLCLCSVCDMEMVFSDVSYRYTIVLHDVNDQVNLLQKSFVNCKFIYLFRLLLLIFYFMGIVWCDLFSRAPESFTVLLNF